MKKQCVVNAYVGEGWFSKGQERLVQSLKDHSYKGDVLTWSNEPINELYDSACPYTIKAAAIEQAVRLGYRQIIWLDCSVTVVKPMDEWLKIIDEDGYYFMTGGWNCAQECNDKSLEIFGYTRDEAELLPCLWSCIFAFDLNNLWGWDIFKSFIDSCEKGAFHGSRHHDNQSKDKRFLHHRQDQSALSLAFHRSGIEKLHSPNIHMHYSGMNPERKESHVFEVKGGA